MIRKALLVWLAASVVVGAVWVWQEGWTMRPAPTHWWWYALSAWMSGFTIGDMWSTRRRRKLDARLASLSAQWEHRS